MRILLAAMLLCSAPALAQPACTEPQIPPPVDGAHVSSDQLRAAVTAAKGFIALSDVYQSCLVGELDAARTQANADGHALDPVVENRMRLHLAANQKSKEKVGTEINTAIDIYKKTHLK
jgi:hypothetical protein